MSESAVHRLPSATTLRSNWGWFTAVGVLFLAFGIIAFFYVFAATLASVLVLAAMMIVGGISQIIHAFRVRSWKYFAFWLLTGLVYTGAGIVAAMNPILASAALTLLIGASLVVAGVLRLFSARDVPKEWRWWLVLAGIVTLLAGVLIMLGWPANTVWVIGLFLAIDLVYQGAAWLGLGLALRNSSA